MPARKKKMATNVGAGMSTKQMKRKKPYNVDMMVAVEPITANQKIAFESYQEGKNLFLYGAGCKKDNYASCHGNIVMKFTVAKDFKSLSGKIGRAHV